MNELLKKSCRTLELPRVLGMLADCAVCEDARRRALELEPAENIADLRESLADTSAAWRLISLKGSPPIGAVHDIRPNLRRAEMGGSLSMPALLEVAALCTAIRRLKSYSDEGGMETVLDSRFYMLQPDRQLEEHILACIISEDEMADSASPTLHDIRRRIRIAGSRVRDTLQRIITSPDLSKYLQDAIITQRSGRFVVPVKSEAKNSIPGLVHDVSSSGSTFFIEPAQVVELNNEIRELSAKEQKEIERILAELSDEVAKSAQQLAESYAAIVELDFTFAKAKLANIQRASEPVISDGYELELKKARHPLLNRDKTVPVTVRLGGEFDTLVVTGPNTGGKTVTLKTIGLFSLMAACGLYIPAEEGSRVPLFRGIYADIGDEQSIEQSLSTFSSHMRNITAILADAGEGSLVLFDELGAGTDPVEGAALAVSIILHTRQMGCLVAATTHYAELKEFALTTDGVENAGCEFDVETLRPTYRLLIGVPGKSNAFAISRRLGLDEGIIEAAEGLVSSGEKSFDDALGRLESERRELEALKEEQAALRREAADAAQRARKFRSDAEKEKSRARERAAAEAQKIIDRARGEVSAMFAELDALREKMLAGATAQEAVDELNRAKSELRGRLNAMEGEFQPKHETPKTRKPDRPIVAGDTVRIAGTGAQATVITPPDKPGGQLTVQAGAMKITLKSSQVELCEPEKPKNTGYVSVTVPRTESLGTRQVSSSLDLRGMSSDEALMELDNFIDAAVLSNLPSVTIVHGKGSGVLRAAVQQHLRGDRRVKSFRTGRYGEGETGVTIVEF